MTDYPMYGQFIAAVGTTDAVMALMAVVALVGVVWLFYGRAWWPRVLNVGRVAVVGGAWLGLLVAVLMGVK